MQSIWQVCPPMPTIVRCEESANECECEESAMSMSAMQCQQCNVSNVTIVRCEESANVNVKSVNVKSQQMLTFQRTDPCNTIHKTILHI